MNGHCADCNKATDRVYGHRWGTRPNEITTMFLCASCEYLRSHPEAKRGTAYPREMRKLPLQKDVLF